ncbi:hypothetical protein FQR65_LT10414 [Abscondita terminalis]|nr:hypothetical protein FQR65_LT10414 [Abscondita terminalis]
MHRASYTTLDESMSSPTQLPGVTVTYPFSEILNSSPSPESLKGEWCLVVYNNLLFPRQMKDYDPDINSFQVYTLKPIGCNKFAQQTEPINVDNKLCYNATSIVDLIPTPTNLSRRCLQVDQKKWKNALELVKKVLAKSFTLELRCEGAYPDSGELPGARKRSNDVRDRVSDEQVSNQIPTAGPLYKWTSWLALTGLPDIRDYCKLVTQLHI